MSTKRKLNVLVVGSGGREHALAWKISQESNCGDLFIAPGNSGTASLGENIDIKVEDINKLSAFASDHKIGLVLVGPEVPLALGLVDAMNRIGIPAFGPTKKAARLETDKAFAARFLKSHNIPRPESSVFTDVKKALAYIKNKDPHSYVLKASGLCAGKGVLLPDSYKEAKLAIQQIMSGELFGDAGKTLVIQERLSGPEVSILAFSDGKIIVPLLPSQDHKRLKNNDKGPNTGGMGAYAPVPVVTNKILGRIQKEILQKTIDGMRKDGILYKGVLYAGLMITKDGPKVLEYNARFGDPETQPLMMLLKSDLSPILLACVNGTLKKSIVKFHRGYAVSVVLASKGYPEKPEKGKYIKGIKEVSGKKNVMVFHAGTSINNGKLATHGGRVLGVTAYGSSMKKALKLVYSAIGAGKIRFSGMHYRKDIGKGAYGS